MSDSPYLCPVCQQQNATISGPRDLPLVVCARCGEYHISFAYAEALRQSSAPLSSDYRVSHAFRWAMRGKGVPKIGKRYTERLLQRRRVMGESRTTYRYLLRWLAQESGDIEPLCWEGWTAILNGKSAAQTAKRVERMAHWGIVSVEKQPSSNIKLHLADNGHRIIQRQMERSRRTQQRRMRAERESLIRQPKESPTRFYASRLWIENYKCFGERQEMSFQDENGRVARWTFLLGENGVGKTSILHLVAGLSPFRRPSVSHANVAMEQWSDSIFSAMNSANDSFNVEAEFHQGALGEDLTNPAIFGMMGQSCSLDDLETSLKLASANIQMSWRNGLSYSANFRAIPLEPLIVGYGASRAVGKVGLAPERGRLDATNSLFHPEIPLQDPEEWLLRNDYASRFPEAGGVEGVGANQKLASALTRLLPDVSELKILPPDAVHNRPWVGFQTSLGLVDFAALSTGYRSTIAWIIDLAIRLIEHYPELNNPLEQPAIVLIDEIDLHLHPTWQRSITADLEALFPAAQFIATTHSPLIIQGAVEANLVLLRSDGHQVVAINDVDEIRHFRVDQILTSELFGLNSARGDAEAELFRRRTEILSGSDPQAHAAELGRIDIRLRTLPSLSGHSISPSALALLKNLKS